MYVTLARYTFIQMGFVWFNLVALAYVAVYMIGPAKGGAAAQKFHRFLTLTFALVDAAIVVFALVSGQWALFMREYGLSTLLELLMFGFGWVGFMLMLSHSYVRNRLDNEEKGALNPQGKSNA